MAKRYGVHLKMRGPSEVASRTEVPRAPARIVGRERLLALLLEARRRRCVVLQGPAGCGKTTVVLAFRRELQLLGYDVAWLTLTSRHNDATHFLDELLSSFSRLSPDIVSEAAQLAGRGSDAESVEGTVVAIARGIASLGQRDLVLVLDDLHLAHDPMVEEALQWLLDYAPPNLHTVLVSRSAVPLSLARLRSQGLVLELEARDLRFTAAETEQFLQATLGTVMAAMRDSSTS